MVPNFQYLGVKRAEPQPEALGAVGLQVPGDWTGPGWKRGGNGEEIPDSTVGAEETPNVWQAGG